MKVTRRTGGGFLGAVALVATSLWSFTNFQHVPLQDAGPLPLGDTQPALNMPARIITSAPAPLTASPISVLGQRQIAIINEILTRGRDEDPRMDTELQTFEPNVRRELETRYKQQAYEKRNRRGTLVFLLGRNLKSAGDFAFLKDVLDEPACLSLSDCTRKSGATESHQAAQIAVTLAYPQLVALDALDQYLNKVPANKIFEGLAVSALEAGVESQVPAVAQMARRLREKHFRSIARMDHSPTAKEAVP